MEEVIDMGKSNLYRLILTSRGLNTNKGTELIRCAYEKEKMEYGSIFLLTFPEYGVDEIVKNNCEKMGFKNIFLAKEFEGKSIESIPKTDAIYVTEGNTFEIVEYIRQNGFDEYIRNSVNCGATYIGSSAGAILASGFFQCALDFDSNFSGVLDFNGFGFLPRKGALSDIIIPHYTYKQVQCYISSLTEEEVKQYGRIYNVANDEVLVLDCKRTEDQVQMLNRRRIRIP